MYVCATVCGCVCVCDCDKTMCLLELKEGASPGTEYVRGTNRIRMYDVRQEPVAASIRMQSMMHWGLNKLYFWAHKCTITILVLVSSNLNNVGNCSRSCSS